MNKCRYKNSFSQREMYNSYKENRKQKPNVKREEFFEIVAKFNREIIKNIIYNNLQFKMPYRLGVLSIIKIKRNQCEIDENGNLNKSGMVIDRPRTWALWKVNPKAREEKKYVYHLNEHTDGYLYKYSWEKKGANVPNIMSYKFNPIRANKKWLYDVLTDEELKVDYFEIKNKKYV